MPLEASCDDCDARCCRNCRVAINGSDAWRLAQGLGQPIHAFAQMLPVEPGDRGALHLDGSERHWSLHLRHRGDGCALLVEQPDGRLRCGVYEHRPGSCRMYPVALEAGGLRIRSDARCPPHGCGFDALPWAHWTRVAGRAEAEWELYETVLGEWERERPDTDAAAGAAGYLAWLPQTYAKLGDLSRPIERRAAELAG